MREHVGVDIILTSALVVGWSASRAGRFMHVEIGLGIH
jgi:hypothetical protein